MGVIHRFLECACNYRRDLNFSEVLLALRDVDLREGCHMGSFPRGGPLASFQGNIPDLMNNTCEDLSVTHVWITKLEPYIITFTERTKKAVFSLP